MNHRLFITGEIFHDFGLLQLYEFLNHLTTCRLADNFIEFSSFDETELFNLIRKALEDRQASVKADEEESGDKGKIKLINFPYMRNSPKFGGNIPGDNKQKTFDENLKETIRLFVNEARGGYENKFGYENGEKCSICFINPAPLKDFSGDRVPCNSLYPLMGEKNSDKSNYRKESIQICFTCEFLALLSLIKHINTIKNNSIFFSRSLKFNYQLNRIMLLKQGILSEANKLRKLLNYSKANIKEFQFKYKQNQFNIEYLHSHSIEKLLNYFLFKDIIENFRFGRNASPSIVLKEIKQGNYGLVKGILLANIVYIKDSSFDADGTRYNLKNYLEFLKISGGKKMSGLENNETKNKQFFAVGKELKGFIADGEKVKKLTLKLIQLLQGNDRTTLLEEIMRVLIINQATIPSFTSEMIMRSSEDDLHLYVGSFIEGLNAADKSN